MEFNISDLKVGDILLAKENFQWLTKGNLYPITKIESNEITLGKGLIWNKESLNLYFYLLKN